MMGQLMTQVSLFTFQFGQFCVQFIRCNTAACVFCVQIQVKKALDTPINGLKVFL